FDARPDEGRQGTRAAGPPDLNHGVVVHRAPHGFGGAQTLPGADIRITDLVPHDHGASAGALQFALGCSTVGGGEFGRGGRGASKRGHSELSRGIENKAQGYPGVCQTLGRGALDYDLRLRPRNLLPCPILNPPPLPSSAPAPPVRSMLTGSRER